MDNNLNHEWMIEFIHEIFKQKEGFITSLQVNDKDIDGFINLNEFKALNASYESNKPI